MRGDLRCSVMFGCDMDLLANFEVETKKMCLSCYNMLLTRFGFFFFFGQSMVIPRWALMCCD